MAYYALKILISALLVTAISEVAKRHSGVAALLASLPITSLLAFIWLHWEGAPAAKISELSVQILWLTIPSLVLFVVLPLLLRHGLAFWLSLVIAIAATAATYLALLPLLRRLGVNL